MDMHLVVEAGGTDTPDVWLRNLPTVVGRRVGCGLRITSQSVSREHCRLERRGDAVVVVDLDSSNGTLVNGTSVTAPRRIRTGDLLTIGSIAFRVQLPDDVDEDQVGDSDPITVPEEIDGKDLLAADGFADSGELVFGDAGVEKNPNAAFEPLSDSSDEGFPFGRAD